MEAPDSVLQVVPQLLELLRDEGVPEVRGGDVEGEQARDPEPPLDELYTDVYTHPWGPFKGTSPPEMLREGD